MKVKEIFRRKIQPDQPHKRRNRYYGSLILAAIVSIGWVAFLIFHQRSQTGQRTGDRAREAAKGRRIEVVKVKKTPHERELELIGETRAFFSVTLYARVSGYMTGLFADIGDHVKQGQTLAHVESPEQEQAYNSARANAINLRRISDRMRTLRARKLVSQQQADQALSDAQVSEANLKTQSVLRSYQNIVAPFDGIISNRFVDPGWLLQNASSSQAASQPLFTLTESDPLRVFSYVDQKDAPYVHAGDPVVVTLPNQPDARYPARIDKVAAELDPRTRTLLTEAILDNPGSSPGAPGIVAGSFVRVHLKIRAPEFLSVPIQALVMRQREPYVPVIGPEDKIHFARIDMVENDGENVFIRSGVEEGEEIALNLGNSVKEGQKIQIAPSARTTQAAGTAR